MPLVRVTMLRGKSPEFIKQLSQSIYESLVEAYLMPENDLFQVIEQLDRDSLIYDRRFGIEGERSDDFVLINIESDARRRDEKQAFVARLVAKLGASPGLSPDDVFVRLSTNTVMEDWSFGGGKVASDIEYPAA